MKTHEQVLTEWANDSIFFHCPATLSKDNHTREEFTKFCEFWKRVLAKVPGYTEADDNHYVRLILKMKRTKGIAALAEFFSPEAVAHYHNDTELLRALRLKVDGILPGDTSPTIARTRFLSSDP